VAERTVIRCDLRRKMVLLDRTRSGADRDKSDCHF
jgi:hypothetical protein